MDIKDMEFFRLEDRMLFEAAAAANIVAAADAAQNAGDDGNNNEEKNNNDLNVALFVAPEANADNTENTDVAAVADIDAQAKDIVEGALPAMDDANAVIPAVAADIDANAEVDAHHDFVEGTLHVDNADSFTVDANDADADADADHDILGDWLANDDIDANADDVSVDGAVAAIAAEHTTIDIDADADADDANSDDFDAATRAGGNHDLSLDFTANKVYDGTNDVENGELQLNAMLDGDELSVNGIYNNNTWTFSFSDAENNNYMVMVQNVTFDGTSIDTDSITIGSFTIDGGNLNDVDVIVNGEELVQTRAAENLRADGSIDQLDITLKVRDAHMQYGDDESKLINNYEITAGALVDGDSIFTKYELSSALDANRTDSGNIQYSPKPYEDAISFRPGLMILDDNGNDVSSNYNITLKTGSLNVTQRVLSVTIKDYTVNYGDALGDSPAYEGVGYTFDGNALAAGDTLEIVVGYNITESDLSSSGHVSAGPHSGMLVEASHTLSNAENYSYGVNTGNLFVTAKGIEVSYVALDKEYDGTTATQRDTTAGYIYSEDIYEGDVVRIFDNSVQYAFAQSDVGTDIQVIATDNFIIVGKDAASYDIHINLVSEADITPKPVDITFTADNKYYDATTDAALTGVTIKGVINDGDVTIDMDQMSYAFSDKNVGDGKTVTAEGYKEALLGGDKLQNYDVTFHETTTANIMPLAIKVIADDQSMTYGDDVPALTYTFNNDDLVGSDEINVALALEVADSAKTDAGIIKAGEYDDVITAAATIYDADGINVTGNYEITYDLGNLTVDLRNVTVTAKPQSMTYGDENPDLTDQYEVEGLLDSDTIDVTLDYDYDNIPTSDSGHFMVGEHDAAIIEADHTLTNAESYNYTFVAADLTVEKRAITVVADDKTMTYGDDAPAFTYTFNEDDLAEGDEIDVALALEVAESAKTGAGIIKAGEYADVIAAAATIYAGEANAVTENYEITYEFGDLTVVPRNVIVTAKPQSMTYGAENPDLAGQYEVEGLLDSDTLDVTLDYDYDSIPTSDSGHFEAGEHEGAVIEAGHTLTNAESYDYTFVAADLTVGKYAITIVVDDKSMTYGDDVPVFTYTFNEDDLAEGDVIQVALDLDIAAAYKTDAGNIKAGEYADVITASATVYDGEANVVTGNYEITYEFGDLTVDLRNITVTAKNQEMTYGDDMPGLEGEYTFDENALAEGDTLDVTLAYQIEDGDLSSSGNVTAGLHAGMVVEESHSLTNGENYNYTFNAASLNVLKKDATVSFNAEDKDYDGTTDATRDGDFVIDGVVGSDDVRAFDTDLTYAFDAPNVLRDADGNVLDRTVTADGELITVGKDVENYNIAFENTAEAKINPLELTVTAIDQSMTYGAENPDLAGQYTVEGLLEIDTLDVTLDYDYDSIPTSDSGHFEAGEHEGAVIEAGHTLTNAESYDYTFVAADLTVTKRVITVIADDKSMTYGDDVPAFTYTFNEDDLAEGDVIQVTLDIDIADSAKTAAGNIKAGEYADVITAAATIYNADGNVATGNYEITYEFGDLTVDLRNITVTAKPQEMIYGDDMPGLEGEYTFDENALAEGDTLDVTLAYQIEDGDKSSSGNVIAGLHPGMIVEEGHVLTNGENYNYNFNAASLNVTPKDITVSFNAEDKDYDGTTDATRDGDFVIDGVVSGDDVRAFDTDLTYAFDAPNVLRDADGNVLDRTVTADGELITVGKDTGNYNITFINTTEAKITPIALTVTAIDQSMTYGDENPDLTGQYSFDETLLVPGDTLDVTLTYDSDNIPTSASDHFKAGEHDDAIIEAGHTLTNAESYDYTFIAADLTVDKRPITITAEDKEITYGDEVGELPYTITGEVADGDSAGDTTLAVDGEENDNGHYNAGEYDIIIGELSLDENDYDITYEPATLIVNQKEITVIADDKTKEERKPDPRLTYTVDGLLDDDKLSGRLTREPGEAPGEYEIQQGTLVSDDNYIITYIPGTLTITEKPEEPETPPPPRNIYQEPEQSNRNYNGPMSFELADYRPIIPDIHPKWDFRSRFDDHRVDPLANSQDLWMDINSLDTLLVSKVISASNSANERGFSSGNEMFPNDTQTPINSVTPSDDFDAPLIDYIDIHGSNDADMPWIFMDESIQIPKFLEQDIADDAMDDADMLDSLADVRLDEMCKHAAFKSDVELLLDGLLA